MLATSRLIHARILPLAHNPWARSLLSTQSADRNVGASAKARGNSSGAVEEGDPPEGRIVETELRHEAERSYMAV